MLIKIERLKADVAQPRQEFQADQMKRLEESIKEKGILNNLKVEKSGNDFIIIDGERRFRAATALGMKELPCDVLEPMEEVERMTYRFHIQEQHASWTPFDRARAIAFLQKSMKANVLEVANLIGMAGATVSGYLTLLSLSKRSTEIAGEHRIPFETMKRIGYIKSWYLKKTGDPSNASKLEDIMISRYVEGVLTALQLRRLAYAFMKDETSKLVENYIASKVKNEQMIIDRTGTSTDLLFRDLNRHSSSVLKKLKEVAGKGIEKDASGAVVERMEDVRKMVDAFLQKTGYTPERRGRASAE